MFSMQLLYQKFLNLLVLLQKYLQNSGPHLLAEYASY